MCSRTLMLTILIVGVVFLSGCSIVSPPLLPIQPGRDQWGCDRPYESVVLNKNELELAAVNVGKFTLGKLDYKSQPELVEVMTKASADLLVVDYLICVAIKRGDIDPNDPEQVNYIRKFQSFMQSKPSPEQILEWQNKNPFPRKQGKLEVSGPFASLNSDKLLVFKDYDIFRKVTIINTGRGVLISWIDGFPFPYFFCELADGQRVTIQPKDDNPFNISRTPVNPEKQKPYPFKVKADSGEHVVITLRVDPNNPGPYNQLKTDFLNTLKDLKQIKLTTSREALALEAAEKVVGKKFPAEEEGFRSFLAGQLLFVLGHYEASVLAYKRAETSDPQISRNFQHKYFLGIAEYFAKRPNEAAKQFTEVSKIKGRPIATIPELYQHAKALGVPDSVIGQNVWSAAFLSFPAATYDALINRLPIQISTASADQMEIENVSGKLPPPEYFTAVREGRLDLAVLPGPYNYSAIPIINIASLPGLFSDTEAYKKVLDEFLFDTFSKVLREKYNLILLATGALPGSLVFSTDPIKTVDDLKGKRIIVTNPGAGKLAAGLGATPTTLAFAEYRPALERGLVQGWVIGPEQGDSVRVFEITKYAYNWQIGDLTSWFIVANQKSWNSIPPDLQLTLRSQFAKMQAESFATVAQEAQRALDLLRQKGVTIVTPSKADLAKIHNPNLLNEIRNGWVQLNKEWGIDADIVLYRTRKILGVK